MHTFNSSEALGIFLTKCGFIKEQRRQKLGNRAYVYRGLEQIVGVRISISETPNDTCIYNMSKNKKTSVPLASQDTGEETHYAFQ